MYFDRSFTTWTKCKIKAISFLLCKNIARSIVRWDAWSVLVFLNSLYHSEVNSEICLIAKKRQILIVFITFARNSILATRPKIVRCQKNQTLFKRERFYYGTFFDTIHWGDKTQRGIKNTSLVLRKSIESIWSFFRQLFVPYKLYGNP